MPGPAPKHPDQRRRRNREQWTVLPAEGCDLAVPGWPLQSDGPSPEEEKLWREVWGLPIACWWHAQRISPYVVCRYVRAFIADVADPTLKLAPAVSRMERDLGLHPEALAKLHLTVEEVEKPREEAQKEARRHLRAVDPGAVAGA